MSAAPLPPNEGARLQALRSHAVLDTEAEASFDEIAELAREICGTPTALLTFVDAERQWVKARAGFTARETAREIAFCAHAILGPDVMVVPDATLDPRFASNPLVTDAPHVRFYAGAPLILANGHAIGTVAVLDYVPRELDDAKRGALAMLARHAVAQLELRWRLSHAADEGTAQKDALLSASLDAIVVIDRDGAIVEFNPSAEQAFGYARQSVVGRPLVDVLIPEELRAAHRDGFAHHLATGEERMMNRRIETVAVRADGTQIPVELAIARLGHTEPPMFVGFLRDVSDRKRAETAVRREMVRFHLAARATSDVIWDWDLVTNDLWWGDRFQALFGYPPDEVEPDVESWTTRVHEDDLLRVESGRRRVFDEHGNAWSDEYRFRRSDGTYAEILDRGYIIRSPGGDALRMIGAMIDVTARKAAEESEERYRDLFEDVGEAIFALTADGVITSMNRAAEAMLGGPRDAWIGHPFSPIVHADDRALTLARFAQVMRCENPPTFEIRLAPALRGEVHVEVTLTPRRSGDRLVGILGIGRDIGERKRLEEQLRQSQKLEALGQLSGGVAHDFNNLLTVIRCGAELLDPTDLSDFKERVDEIRDAAERGAALTRQLLVASRRQAMRPAPVDLNAVVRDMTKMLQRIVSAAISIKSAYAPVLPVIRADARMLEQVLLNLVVNAGDAMPNGGTLTISTSAVVVDAEHMRLHPESTIGDHVCLSVRDTGTGVAPAVLPHIFEAFFTTKPVGEGSGLGLATVYGIVKQHGGWVEVESTVGEGSVFAVYLPVAEGGPAEKSALHAAMPARPLGGRETVLVVEDEDAVRVLATRVLSGLGYTVLAASSGAAALEVWRQHRDRIDLLFTDLVMPGGMTGRELAEALRHDRPGLKVLYASGYSADLIDAGALLVEGENFLQKPYQPDGVAQIVRGLLDRPDAKT